MTNRLDLPLRYREQLDALLREHVPGVEVWAYGSCVNGGSHDGSDLDLVLRSSTLEPLGYEYLELIEGLEQSNIPILVQTHDWARLPESFHREIQRNYVVLQAAQEEKANGKWHEASWGDLVTLEYGKSLREYRDSTGPYRVYGTNGPVGWNDEPLCHYPSVIVGRKGAYRGIHYSPEPFFVIDTAFYVKPKVEIDTRWAYYQLRTQDINGLDSGSAIPSTSREDFYALPVSLPPLPEQRAIAGILGALDDKIELNRRMNETLEQMARASFQSWFVDFEPVRAKMTGREPNLPPELWDLFPDRLVDSDLGEIPEGWAVGEIGDVATQRRQGVKPKDIGPDTPYIALEHMPRKCVALSERGKAEGLASGKFRFRKSDILFGKLRPYFHKVGVAPLDGVCSTDIVVVSPKTSDWFGFALGHLSSPEFVDYTDATSTGTRMPRANWQDMASYKIPLPRLEIARSYAKLVRPWIDKIISNIHESYSLATQRDTLLPRLVSGELWVEVTAPNLRLPDCGDTLPTDRIRNGLNAGST